MALFLSTVTNKVDKKGRVSVPAPFRAALDGQDFQGVVLFRSNQHPCLEGFDYAYMQQLSDRLDHFDMFSDQQDDLAASIFGDCVQLAFDGDGRITLPIELMEYATVVEKASFVGMGKKFQIWSPESYATRRDQARENVRAKGLTIPARGVE